MALVARCTCSSSGTYSPACDLDQAETASSRRPTFVADDVDGPDLAGLDHPLDVGLQRCEDRRWQQVPAAVEQRTRVERVHINHGSNPYG